ncbi:MAG TPA: DUF3445 domain-containing protein [Iamia sp.]|nr:DUF3445 domain-containing protein [Iamia sp.]
MAVPGWLDELDVRAEGPPWLAMGLRKGTEDGWLVADEHRSDELIEKERLLARRWDDVVHLGPGTEEAGAEVRGLVAEWLAAHGLPSPAATGEHPLVEAARAVQEDLCLMVPRPLRAAGDGIVRHHLDAAVLCFPSHWRLADKAGGSALAIHGPVPGYDVELADKVDRYLARLRPDVIGVRRNWSIHDSPRLHAPVPPAAPPALDPDTVGSALWLRSERQTLRALPRSGAVLFTIRVQQTPFATLAGRPDVAAALALRLRAEPAALVAMNGLERRVEPVVSWLDSVSSTG